MSLTIFCGAGCSMLPPTSLPSWWNVNRAVIDALVERASGLLPEARELGNLVVARQDALKFPPEYFAEVVVGTVGQAYFDVLQSLDSQTPNAVHDTLARLAASRQVRAIITTNFDRAIEAAFERQQVPLAVRYRADQLQELAANLGQLDAPDGVCQLLKIHGSADAPATLIDTLSQRKRGLPVATVQCIKHLLRSSRWLFIGYSGADLEADPNYLFLRASAGTAQGFTWLVRSGTEPLAAVKSLVDAYTGNAKIETGTLPEWLQVLLAANAPPARADAPSSAAVVSSVAERAAAWTSQVGGFACAAILASLANAAGHSPAALTALQCLYERHAFSARAIDTDHPDAYSGTFDDASSFAQRVYCLATAQLAVLLRDEGKNEDAFGACRHALAVAAALKSPELLAGLMGQYANLQKSTGDLSSAEQTFMRALDVAAEFPAVRADLQNDLGGVFNEQGRLADARAAAQCAVDIRTLTGNEVGRAGALVNLAAFSPPPQAERLYAEALAIFDRLGNEYGRGNTFINIGKLHQANGNWSRSWDSYDSARQIAELVGDGRMRAMALHGQAVALDGQHQDEAALALYQQALDAAASMGFTSESASIHNNLGRLYRDSKDAERTRAEREKALALYETMNSPKGKAEAWYAMGVDAYQLGRLDETVEPFRLAFEVYRSLQDPRHRLEAGNNYASALYDNGRFEESRAVYEQVLPDAEAQNAPMFIVKAITGLASCALRTDRAVDGIALFQDAVARQMKFGGLEAAWSLADYVAGRMRTDFAFPDARRLDFLGNALDKAAKELVTAGQYDAALQYLDRLARMAVHARDLAWIGSAFANIGFVQRQAGRRAEAQDALKKSVDAYRAEQNSKGALFPLSQLLTLLDEQGDSDGLAWAWSELAFCYEATEQRAEAGEAFARAARFWLQPFASQSVATKEEARARATNAHGLLIAAKRLLPAESQMLEGVQYDLEFCDRLLSSPPPKDDSPA